jgi:hypothetical protein
VVCPTCRNELHPEYVGNDLRYVHYPDARCDNGGKAFRVKALQIEGDEILPGTDQVEADRWKRTMTGDFSGAERF